MNKKLSEEEYYVTQLKGTEKAFTGKYLNHKEEGIYCCLCCNSPLFLSKNKYDSGSGWPSFDNPINQSVIKEKEDFSYNMFRIEVQCNKCNAHLGHLFDDGPKPSGKRYCINSISLSFKNKTL